MRRAVVHEVDEIVEDERDKNGGQGVKPGPPFEAECRVDPDVEREKCAAVARYRREARHRCRQIRPELARRVKSPLASRRRTLRHR